MPSAIRRPGPIPSTIGLNLQAIAEYESRQGRIYVMDDHQVWELKKSLLTGGAERYREFVDDEC